MNHRTQAFVLALGLIFFSLSPLEAQFGKKKRQQEREKEQTLTYEEIEREGHDIVEHLDELDAEWHEYSDELATYAGLLRFCTDNEYRRKIEVILNNVHAYDRKLYNVLLSKAELEGTDRTLRKTLKEIEKIEDKYRASNFKKKLNDDCKGAKKIEKNKEKLQRDVQMESFDGKAMVIDNDIHVYIRKVTHLIDLIDKHAHHLLD